MTQIIDLLTYKEQFTPAVVGMGATYIAWSDRYACTVIKVSKSGKTATIQEDTAIRTDSNGMSECQSYRYEPNPNGEICTIRLGKLGWRFRGLRGTKIIMGCRDAYYDYSF